MTGWNSGQVYLQIDHAQEVSGHGAQKMALFEFPEGSEVQIKGMSRSNGTPDVLEKIRQPIMSREVAMRRKPVPGLRSQAQKGSRVL